MTSYALLEANLGKAFSSLRDPWNLLSVKPNYTRYFVCRNEKTQQIVGFLSVSLEKSTLKNAKREKYESVMQMQRNIASPRHLRFTDKLLASRCSRDTLAVLSLEAQLLSYRFCFSSCLPLLSVLQSRSLTKASRHFTAPKKEHRKEPCPWGWAWRTDSGFLFESPRLVVGNSSGIPRNPKLYQKPQTMRLSDETHDGHHGQPDARNANFGVPQRPCAVSLVGILKLLPNSGIDRPQSNPKCKAF